MKQDCLEPRRLDGSGGRVVAVQTDRQPVAEYAEAIPYFSKNVDASPLPSKAPQSPADAAALEAERAQLVQDIASGNLNAEERATASQRIGKLEELLAKYRNRQMHDQGHREQVRP